VPNDNSSGPDNVGQAYVYNLAGATPSRPFLTLHNYFPEENDYYGESVAISDPWVAVVVPGDETGTVLIYNLNGATPNMPVHALNHPYPQNRIQSFTHVALAGSRLAVSWPSRFSNPAPWGTTYTDVFIYDLAGGTPTNPISFREFSATVSFPGIGFPPVLNPPAMRWGIIAINDRGSVSVYNVSTPGAFVPVVPNLINPGSFSDDFGWSVAIYNPYIVVGAPANDTGADNAGQVHIYSQASPTPRQPVITLFNPNPAAGDRFGERVAISGSRVVVGTAKDDAGNVGNGSAYVFDIDSANPNVPVAMLNNPAPAANDLFASAIAIDGSAIVIGAPGDDTVAPDKGFGYIFAPANADFDADGLFDGWEVTEFAGSLSYGANDDPDGDGRTNANEFDFLTDPENGRSFFTPGMTRVPPNNIVISFLTAAGRTYTLERSDTLAPGSWTSAGLPAITGDGSLKQFTVPDGPPARRYFRVMAGP
jgi:hypothetical protein